MKISELIAVLRCKELIHQDIQVLRRREGVYEKMGMMDVFTHKFAENYNGNYDRIVEGDMPSGKAETCLVIY